MPSGYPAPPGKFVGRDTYINRFKARVEHFPLFVYEGISGTGKTALMLRLAKETKAVGTTKALYLTLSPGEAIGSILARVEARLNVRVGSTNEQRQGDPFGRLAEVLDAHRSALIIDDLHHIRREDLSALARVLKGREGRFRILGAADGDLELSAMDRMSMYCEKVGQLVVDDVMKIGASFKLSPEATEALKEDAQRGGCVCQPITLRPLLAMRGSDLPVEALSKLSARSANAFKMLLTEPILALPAEQKEILSQLSRINAPVDTKVATKALGKSVNDLLELGLLDEIDGEVYVHSIVSQVIGSDAKIPSAAAKAIAKYLQDRAIEISEPVGVIRAGELLAHSGAVGDAVEALSSGWESVRDFGFLEAYLKTLASIDPEGTMASRVQLLAARARMRKGNPASVREEMLRLSKDKDSWTKSRALAALTFVHSSAGEHEDVVKTYDALKKASRDAGLLIPAGSLAARSMVKVGDIKDAETLSLDLLGKLKGRKEPEHEGELHRLLARVYARSGQLKEAVAQAQLAAKSFEATGDLYHAATAHGFIGDLYRETGEFEEAKKAFQRFHELAEVWGDRNLIQIAELADAWVSLDIGDLPHAAKQVDRVEKEMSAAPSRRLRRYLAAARALLDAGRGLHESAASAFPRVVEAWDAAGQRAIADVLRAQHVRSLIAIGNLDEADKIVKKALSRLDPKTAAPRVASFLRESALIRLRRKDVKKAMSELAQARKLFAQGGNRREEALTLHRIAHAALEEGDAELASTSVKEALALAKKIKHARAIALAREVQGRVLLLEDKTEEALAAIKEALQSLRKLGDDIGTLHVSESMLRAQIVAGDLSGAIRLGPKVREHAERLTVREIRIRAIVLTGVALLRRARIDQASKCFKELPAGALSPYSEALMWRLGEALAAFKGEKAAAVSRRAEWMKSVQRVPEDKQEVVLTALEQLQLPPRHRCHLKVKGSNSVVSSERVAWLEPADYDMVIDLLNNRFFDKGEAVAFTDKGHVKLIKELTLNVPRQVAFDAAVKLATGSNPDKPEKEAKAVVRDINKVLGRSSNIKIELGAKGMKLALPKKFAVVTPTTMAAELDAKQKKMVKLLARLGAAPIQTLQDEFELTRAAARREVGVLIDAGLVEAIRDGRGQAFRLA